MQAMWFSEIFSFAGWLAIAFAKVFFSHFPYLPLNNAAFGCQYVQLMFPIHLVFTFPL